MTMDPFIESGMTFGQFTDGHCFRVETSHTYRAIQEGVPMAEFLLYRPQEGTPPTIWIVEAKQSSPHPETQPHFDEFIEDIRDKLVNALTIGVCSILGRHSEAAVELSDQFKNADLARTGFRLILIINGHRKEWLPPLQDALRSKLRATAKTWALGPNAVVVMNEDGARRCQLLAPVS